jgi:Domain of unknown function (DUF1877)
MSMICELLATPDEVARQVAAKPSGIHKLLATHLNPDQRLSLEKSWHGLHFVLTGSAWEGEEPLNFLASGGQPIGEEDVGYGPARALFATGVAALDKALASVNEDEFRRRFDLAGMVRAEVYPSIWDEPLANLLEEYGSYFQEFKSFVHTAAERGYAIVVAIT